MQVKNPEGLSIKEVRTLIDYCKNDFLKNYDMILDENKKNYFNFSFKDTNEYNSFKEFCDDVKEQGYSISFHNISKNYIDNLEKEGKLYLFKIHCKDFSKDSKGTPNLHTLYWKMLFDKDNLKNLVYKLCGNGEIFYRKLSIKKDNIIKHDANVELKNKNELNEKANSLFSYELIKDKRYTMDKYQLHIPITINFISKNKTNINDDVNKYIKENGINYIIGLS